MRYLKPQGSYSRHSRFFVTYECAQKARVLHFPRLERRGRLTLKRTNTEADKHRPITRGGQIPTTIQKCRPLDPFSAYPALTHCLVGHLLQKCLSASVFVCFGVCPLRCLSISVFVCFSVCPLRCLSASVFVCLTVGKACQEKQSSLLGPSIS